MNKNILLSSAASVHAKHDARATFFDCHLASIAAVDPGFAATAARAPDLPEGFR
jgi:hypothetical protein